MDSAGRLVSVKEQKQVQYSWKMHTTITPNHTGGLESVRQMVENCFHMVGSHQHQHSINLYTLSKAEQLWLAPHYINTTCVHVYVCSVFFQWCTVYRQRPCSNMDTGRHELFHSTGRQGGIFCSEEVQVEPVCNLR